VRNYLERLRQRGELLITDRPVAARHELAAVTEKVQRTLNRPILFTNVSGTRLPVVTNVYGSRERLAEILGIGPREFCRKWSELDVRQRPRAALPPRAAPPPDAVP
jgi:UbiD family decarboxylase